MWEGLQSSTLPLGQGAEQADNRARTGGLYLGKVAQYQLCYVRVAGGQGFEPQYERSKRPVLPLNDPPKKAPSHGLEPRFAASEAAGLPLAELGKCP